MRTLIDVLKEAMIATFIELMRFLLIGMVIMIIAKLLGIPTLI